MHNYQVGLPTLAALTTLLLACGSGTGPGGVGGFGGGGNSASSNTPPIHLDVDSGTSNDASCAAATTCAESSANCGKIGDGCGFILDCGSTCPTGQTCGGSGKANVCGTPVCDKTTCAAAGVDCGPIADGCGGQLDCGTCSGGNSCGGGGTPSVCGHGSTCIKRTCAQAGVGCGPTGDGCGGTLDCGGCPTGQTCGGGGTKSVCGAPTCTPKSCTELGVDCGPVADGCGGILQCGSCSLPKTCGGSGTTNLCGIPSSCTNLCLKQVTCPTAGVTTTVSGHVFAPNGTDPLVNALVYVPNATVQSFAPGVSCDNCGAATSGSPLVTAVSAVDGSFTLKNVPGGTNIPLVIQVGRWRRQVTIPSVKSCQDNVLTADLTRLPRNHTEGDIPLMAFSTGAVDVLECVMRKIGVDDSEFSGPSGTGRIHLYVGIGDGATSTTHGPAQHGGARANGDYATEDKLWSSLSTLERYDLVLFACQGHSSTRPAAAQQNLVSYANAGGRLYVTHLGATWLANNSPFSTTANWNVSPNATVPDQTGFINTTFPKGMALAQWLKNIDPSNALGQIPIYALRQDLNGVVPPSQTWMTVKNPALVMHYTFNTPVGTASTQQCGRVLFDDFHVEDSDPDDGFKSAAGTTFPSECSSSAMTPQEKLLEFMLFDLSSCVTADIPVCKAKTCNDLGVHCGKAGDGCGNIIDCGTCPSGQTCGGGGVPSVCGAPSCTPSTCTQLRVECGPAGDGCGKPLDCGTCPSGQTCGGGGQPGVCGTQACVKRSCDDQGISCGPAGDGCGGLLQCGTCPSGQTCGGGGKPGVCGGTACTPRKCQDVGADCGALADGCGNVIDCGTCSVPLTCGGGGKANVCGGSAPIPL